MEVQQARLLAAERSVRTAAEADAALICKEYERRIGELETLVGQAQVRGEGGGRGVVKAGQACPVWCRSLTRSTPWRLKPRRGNAG